MNFKKNAVLTAKSLARKGVPTFPINKNEKTPSVSGGFKSATTDIYTIESSAKVLNDML